MGTSLAAPLVTGTIALMMEKDTMLMGYPERIMAILSASSITDGVNNLGLEYVSGMYQKAGAGLINVGNALDLITSVTWTITKYPFSYRNLKR